MPRYIAVMLLLPPLGAQSGPPDLACITTIGEIAYPPYEWGAGRHGLARAEIQLGSNARPEDIRTSGLESAFTAEARRSALASVFDTACPSRKLSVTYRFQLAGEPSETRDVAVRKDAIQITVSAPPAALRCGSEATSEDEAAANVGRGERLLDERKLNEALQCADSALRRKPLHGAYIVKGIALRKLGRVTEAIAAYDELESTRVHKPIANKLSRISNHRGADRGART